MMAVAAIAGPQRVSWLHKGDVLDAEKLLGGRMPALRVGSTATQTGGLQERSFGLTVSFARAAPLWFRVAALSEDGLATEAAGEEPVHEEPAVGVPAFEGPTVKVKFEFQRECHFGQQFKVVGGDSQFGDWDPSAGVPLNWTEGHLWTAEVDVPEGKKIEYKYVLSGQGEIEWQPGANHVLEASAGAGSLVISELWEEPQPEPTAEPEIQSAETDSRGWETVSGDPEVRTPADALADTAASAAVGVLNTGLKAATALGGGLDALSDSPNRETNGVTESKEEAPTAIEIPVVDAALSAAAAPAAPAEEPVTKNGATTTNQPETATTEEELNIEEQYKMDVQPRIEEQSVVEPKKRVNPFQKDIDWLSKTFFGR